MIDYHYLLDLLESLPRRHQTVFAACCTERMLENYEAFVRIEQWGDASMLRQGLDAVWAYLAGEEVTIEMLQQHADLCLRNTPDTDDFNYAFTGNAMRAAASVIYTLRSLYQDEFLARYVLNNAFNCLDLYLYWMTTPVITAHAHNKELEAWIDGCPLLHDELARQQRTLDELQKLPRLTPENVAKLRQSCAEGGIRPISRGLFGSGKRSKRSLTE